MNFCGKVTDVLLPSAAKRVELINFSRPKRCFGLRDNPADISNILDNPEFFRIFEVFRLRQTKKGHRIWILYVEIQYIDIKNDCKTFILVVFNIFTATVIA